MVNKIQQIQERTENIKAFREVINRDHQGKTARFTRAAGVPENFMGQVHKYMAEGVMLKRHILALLVAYTEMRSTLATTEISVVEHIPAHVDQQNASAVAPLSEAMPQKATALSEAPVELAPIAAADQPPVVEDRWKVLHAQVQRAREAFRKAIAEFESVPVTAVIISHTVESRR